MSLGRPLSMLDWYPGLFSSAWDGVLVVSVVSIAAHAEVNGPPNLISMPFSWSGHFQFWPSPGHWCFDFSNGYLGGIFHRRRIDCEDRSALDIYASLYLVQFCTGEELNKIQVSVSHN
jgi:hypothetical protein